MSDQFEKKIILGDVPYSLSIEATAYCKLRCTMCANRKLKRKKGYMELDLYKKIIDEVTSVSTNFNLWLNGYGESFLNADIFDMIKYAKDKKIKHTRKEQKTMTKTLKIEGMMCPHCEATVKKALEAIDGVTEATADHNTDTAVVTLSKDVSNDVLRKAVEDKDYPVKDIQ